jgi:ABC-2 type transport system ATP-binding protein
MDNAISVENLGIRFNRNRKRKFSIREMVLQNKNTTPRGAFWALRNVSFEVKKGEAVGLVGANGQGKSTLLRIIAGVLIPDEGKVTVNGGVAPVIELTGGLKSDLTARDNIWLVARLHGLTKKQVAERFDDIVEFSGIEDFLDTPVRHFSSGMRVRLGFSIVTALDEPILLVDEALAVGDAEFKIKCYHRMEQLLAQGKTLFLVSHKEEDLNRFCTRGLYLKKGRLLIDGTLTEALAAHLTEQGAVDE